MSDTGSTKKEALEHDGHTLGSNQPEVLFGEKSPGVQRIEAITSHITTLDKFFIFFGVFLLSYAYGLDGTIRYTYQAIATDSFNNHSLLATINVLRGVISAAAQPTAAKIADVFGRVELIGLSVIFYVVGTIVETCSTNISSFSGGAVLYQIGYTMVIVLVEIVVADTTSLRTRLFFSYIPALPFIINTWVSGDVTQAVLERTTWKWGVGMWCIIYPLCAIPLMLALYNLHRRAKKAGTLGSYRSPFQTLGGGKLASYLFWQLDVIGIVLLIAVFALILVPFTIAGGERTQWKTAKVIAPLVIGFLCIPAWIYWEAKCKHPMVPFRLLKDRAIWAGFGMAAMLNCAWYLQGDYLYTVLVVAFDESVKSATRITSVYSFSSVITGVLVGLIVVYVRRLKPFIVLGTVLFLAAFGMLIHFRGGSGNASHSGLIGAQVLLGIAGGLFPYPTQASVQAATKHEHVAVVTGLYLASYNIGSALGGSISGAIWTQVLPGQLSSQLARVTTNTTMASDVYGSPFEFATVYPIGTPERDAVVEAYRHTQRLLCITGICLSIPLIVLSLLLRNPRLGDKQSSEDAEEEPKGRA